MIDKLDDILKYLLIEHILGGVGVDSYEVKIKMVQLHIFVN